MANPTVQLVLGVSVAAILLALTAVSCPPMWRWGQEKMESRAAGRRAKEQENPTYASGLYYTEEGDRIQVGIQALHLIYLSRRVKPWTIIRTTDRWR